MDKKNTTDGDVLDLSIDINSLTVGEIEEIEDKTGKSIDKLFDPEAPKGKMLRAVAFIVRRRDNPDFTWEEAGLLRINLASDATDPQ